MARYTGAPMWLSPQLADQLELGLPGPHSEEELRAAWGMFGAQILADHHEPGTRPLGFWLFNAGRPEHLLPEPPFTGDPEQVAQAHDEHAIEPILFLAEQGYLRDDEREAVLERARKAKDRLGTDGQLGELRITPAGEKVWLGGDRTTVAIGEALARGSSR